MPVKINYNICDQGKGCPCISACPNGAWGFNEETKRPEIDLSKCDDCFTCVKTCPARAVLAATSEEGMKKIEEELKNYPKTRQELLAPRFNADPSDQESQITSKDFEEKVLKQKGIVIVEFWSNPCVSRCRLNAALYSDILPEKLKDAPVHKVNALENTDLMVKYELFTFPTLIVFKDGEVIESITGYTSISEKEALRERLEKVSI